MTATPAWFIGLYALLAGVALLALGLGGVVFAAVGYRGPRWWRQATGRDVVDGHRSSRA